MVLVDPTRQQNIIKAIEADPLSDADIKRVLGRGCRIIKYSQLKRYSSIERLLSKDVDYVILLYQDHPNRGHWCCVCRYDNIIEFFDAYGTYPDKELLWVPMKTRKQLKQDRAYLTYLFNRTDKEVIYNNVKYQDLDGDIKTCGSHCTHRIYRLIHNNMSLKDYYKYMTDMKKRTKHTYDELVAVFMEPFLLGR